MKLYATVTSERASKGQGGNEYVAINLKDEAQNTFLEVRAIPDGTSTRVSVWIKDKLQTTYYNVKAESKGNKQKGECRHQFSGEFGRKTYCIICNKHI